MHGAVKWWPSMGLALSLAFSSALAGAEDEAPSAENTAAAEALFNEGQALFLAGKALEACPKFAASYRLDRGLGTLLNLARCYEAIGRTASAWAAYVDLEPLALRAGQIDRVDIARERIAVLVPRLVRVVVRISESSPSGDLVVTRDGQPLDAALLGVAVAVDPGTHVFAANRPGHVRWQDEVTLTDEGSTSEVVVPALERAPVKPVNDPSPAPEEPTADAPLPGLLIGGGVAGGVGLVLFAVAGGFAANAASAWSEAGCSDGLCGSVAAQDLSEQAHERADVATGLGVAGGVCAATGVVLLIVGALDAAESDDAALSARGLELRF